MKNNIKIILVIITAILTTNIASAQQRGQRGPTPIPNDEQIEEMVTNLAKELTLSDEQTEQVSDLYFEHFEKVAEEQEKNKESKADGREAMDKLRTDLEEDMNKLLTKDQQRLYKEYMEKQRSQRAGQGRPQGKKQ